MVHQYKLNGYNIVIDSESGSVHSVDECAYDAIEIYESKTKKEIIDFLINKHKITKEEALELLSDIELLKENGTLFSKDAFAKHSMSFKNKQSVVKAICLHVAHLCNMRCEYCFAGDGQYNDTNGLMTLEVGKKSIDWLLKASEGRHNLEVDFFGGEPLLNLNVVKELVAYGRSKEKEYDKNFRFTLTTNGYLLDDETTDFLNKEMSNVVISLDGRKKVNDRMRKTVSQEGTYDLILPGFKNLAEKRGNKDYYMRGTYTHYNTDFSKDLIHMADLGFKELSIEPVVAPSDAPYSLKDDDLPTLLIEYENLANEMLTRKRNNDKNQFNFYHYTIDLDGGPCIVKRISGCGVGTEYVAITPAGDIYPCHQFVGDKKFLLGNIDTGITNNDIADGFRTCNIYSHDECTDCFAKLYCSGGCAANAYHTTGSINGIYEMGCILHKKRIECAIMLKVAEMHENL